MVTPAAITASSHGPGATFLASGGYVLAASPTVARHDADIQVQRFNADGTVAAANTAFDYSGATGLDQALDSASGVAVQPDGKIIAVGFSENNSTGVTDVFLARYLVPHQATFALIDDARGRYPGAQSWRSVPAFLRCCCSWA